MPNSSRFYFIYISIFVLRRKICFFLTAFWHSVIRSLQCNSQCCYRLFQLVKELKRPPDAWLRQPGFFPGQLSSWLFIAIRNKKLRSHRCDKTFLILNYHRVSKWMNEWVNSCYYRCVCVCVFSPLILRCHIILYRNSWNVNCGLLSIWI